MDYNADSDVQPYRLNTLDNGLMVPPFITQKMIADLRWLPLRDKDVFVVTFPKSGTTWMQQVVKLIHGNGEDNDQNIIEAAPWIESVGHKGVKVSPFIVQLGPLKNRRKCIVEN